MQIGRIDSKQPRRSRVVATRSIDGLENEPPFRLDNIPVIGRARLFTWPYRGVSHTLWKIVCSNTVGAPEDCCAFNRILELAHVARPFVRGQGVHSCGRDFHRSTTSVLTCEMGS